MSRLIALLDCNNFFVSCERLFRPDLRTQPVLVLSSNDGCVIARSQEIKDKGIAMGVPYFKIKDTLKDINAVCFSSNFALYRDISRRVFEVVKSEFAEVEEYSIDECFFIMNTEDDVEVVAARLRERVAREIGIPVSIGIAVSKTLAKYAGSIAKRTTGTKYLRGAEWKKLAPTVGLGTIWGVGEGRRRQFELIGLTTAADLLTAPERLVRSVAGVAGSRIQAELAGVAVLPVSPQAVLRQSLTSTRSFGTPSTDIAVLEDAIRFHVAALVNDLASFGLCAARLRVLAYPSRFGDYALRGYSLETTLAFPCNDIFTLTEAAIGLLRAGFRLGIPYQKAGVVLTGLLPIVAVSASLFPISTTKETLSELLLTLNQRHGRARLQLGRVRQTGAWESKQGSLSPAYTTSWSNLPVVKCLGYQSNVLDGR